MNDDHRIPYQSFAVEIDADTKTLKALKNQYVNESRYDAGLSLEKVFWPRLSEIIQQSENYTSNIDDVTISFADLPQDNKGTNMSVNTPRLVLSFFVQNSEINSNLKELKNFFRANHISSFQEEEGSLLIDIDGDGNTNVTRLDNLIKTSNDHSVEHAIKIDDSTSSKKDALFQKPKPAYGATEAPKQKSTSWWEKCNIL